MRSLFAGFLLTTFSSCSADPVVLTGATGHTGSLVYKLLKAKGVDVRAFVRNATKAQERLGCVKCDASEGIFVGDVTQPETLVDVMNGAGALVILTGAFPICNPFPNCEYPKGAFPIDVDWKGGKNQIAALAKGAGLKPIILVSTMGTTTPDGQLDMMGHGYEAFYKLNEEGFLMASGFPYTVIKPCGLGLGEPGNSTLVVGHDDEETWPKTKHIERADLARVVAAIAQKPAVGENLRFDICGLPGKPTKDTDIPALLEAAKYPWERSTVV